MAEAIAKLYRLLNANSTDKDIWLTLTYDDEHLPDSKEKACKDTANYIRRLRRLSTEPLKYVIVTHAYAADGKPTRIHHHIVMNFTDIDAAKRLWNKGLSRCRSLQLNTYELGSIAHHMAEVKKQCKIRHSI